MPAFFYETKKQVFIKKRKKFKMFPNKMVYKSPNVFLEERRIFLCWEIEDQIDKIIDFMAIEINFMPHLANIEIRFEATL